MYCCPNCFNHAFLQNEIKNLNQKYGSCSFCNFRGNTIVCKPSLLIDLFQPLLDLYKENNDGEYINDLIQRDWKIFSKNIDNKNQLKLLSNLTGISDINRIKYASAIAIDIGIIDKWNDFANELKHENRFFPQKTIDIDQLSELFNYLIMPKDQQPKYIHRARINYESTPLKITELEKPPQDKSVDGRANPKGISYFYGSSDEKTAIAETRPHKAENIYVAKYKVDPKITIIDLRDPKSTISPFGFDDDNLILLYREHMPFLVHLRDTLSRPVLPHKKELEYLPTQYLSELIKSNGFNGIAFKSSLDKGDNYVIFNDSFLTALKKLDRYQVTDTKLTTLKL